jgi:hypothetical protein
MAAAILETISTPKKLACEKAYFPLRLERAKRRATMIARLMVFVSRVDLLDPLARSMVATRSRMNPRMDLGENWSCRTRMLPMNVKSGFKLPTIGTMRLASARRSASKKAQSESTNVAPNKHVYIHTSPVGQSCTQGLATTTSADRLPISAAYVALEFQVEDNNVLSMIKLMAFERWPAMASRSQDIEKIDVVPET